MSKADKKLQAAAKVLGITVAQLRRSVREQASAPATRRVTKKGKAAKRTTRVRQGFAGRLPEFAANRELRQALFADRSAAGLPTSGDEWVEAKADAGICDKSTRDAGLN